MDRNTTTLRSRMGRTVSDASSISSVRSDDLWSVCSDESDQTDLTISSPLSSAGDEFEFTKMPVGKPPVRVVLGTASIGSERSPLAKITSQNDVSEVLNLFRSKGYFEVDTARAYPVGAAGTCERLLGQTSLSKWAEVSTKVSSYMPGAHKKDNIARSIKYSLQSLNVDAVDIMYLHAPDRHTSFEVTCEAMNDAFLEGCFQRFGLSNFLVEDVEEIIKICEKKGYVKPSVYQGQYNPVCRDAEDRLISVLREHNIAFYAYSPSACGFFGTTTAPCGGRWNPASPLGQRYRADYFHSKLFNAAADVRKAAAVYGITGHAAALRWTAWHSELSDEFGDALIVGFSSESQLTSNLEILEQGPLPQPVLDVIKKVWETVKTSEHRPKFALV